MIAPSYLVEARRRAGLSQAALASRAGVSPASISRWERGLSPLPFERLRDLVRHCGFDVRISLCALDDSNIEAIADAATRTPDQNIDRMQTLLALQRRAAPQ